MAARVSAGWGCGMGKGDRSVEVAAWTRPQVTAKAIGKRIVSGKVKPGSVLPATDVLAEEFSVSRLAIRETMKILAGKGLVEARPRRGTVVRARSEWNRFDPDILAWQINDAPNAAFIRSLFEVRRIIEPEAAALAAARAPQEVIEEIEAAFRQMAQAAPDTQASIDADVEFHRAILLGTGNDFIAAFAPVIATALKIAIGVQRGILRRREHFVPSHGAILDAIKRGHADGARAAFLTLLGTAEVDAMNGIREREE